MLKLIDLNTGGLFENESVPSFSGNEDDNQRIPPNEPRNHGYNIIHFEKDDPENPYNWGVVRTCLAPAWYHVNVNAMRRGRNCSSS
jgi:hypothetical protein